MKKPTAVIVACELVALGWGAAMVPLAALELLTASTPPGRLFGLAGIAIGSAPVLGAVGWDRDSQLAKRMAEVLLAFFAVTAAILFWRGPAGGEVASGDVQAISPGSEAGRLSTAVSELLPEVDQLQFGFVVMAALDPRFTLQQAIRLNGWTTEIYREMEQDARFRGLRSQLPEAYVEFAGWSVESGHAFLYLPPGLDRTKPNAALVFLHGSGGNFKAYLWLLARLADRLNLVVVAPTCGNGNWRPSDTSRVVAAAFATARRGVVIDPTNIHLLGLSNGGLGVTQLAEVPGAGYRSIIYLSPVFGERHSASAGARRPWRGRPVLVLSGRDDDRVPVRYVQEQAAALVQAEAAVTVELVDETDHFLFFSRSAQVIERLAGWLQQNGVAASPVHEPPK